MPGDDGGAQDSANQSYQLQKRALELQEKQIAELEMKEKKKESDKQFKYDQLLLRKKTGRQSTILTGAKIPGIAPYVPYTGDVQTPPPPPYIGGVPQGGSRNPDGTLKKPKGHL